MLLGLLGGAVQRVISHKSELLPYLARWHGQIALSSGTLIWLLTAKGQRLHHQHVYITLSWHALSSSS